MGAQLAGLLAGAGFQVLLLDRPAGCDDRRSCPSVPALERLRGQRPPALFSSSDIERIQVGNFEDDLAKLHQCDWVIEALAEDPAVKQQVLEQASAFLRPQTWVTTTATSLELSSLAGALAAENRRLFAGTHFFNPPRYAYLVEIVPIASTSDELTRQLEALCDLQLGKGVIRAKDTPGFIATRVAGFFHVVAQKLALEEGLRLEAADMLSGLLAGTGSLGSFAFADWLGLDLWLCWLENLHRRLEHDPAREWWSPPEVFRRLVDAGQYGRKSGQGIFRGPGAAGTEVYDLGRGDYRPVETRFAEWQQFAGLDPARRVEALLRLPPPYGSYAWRVLSEYLCYAAAVVTEVAERLSDVDRAVRWGYGFELGPFQLWDRLGLRDVARKLESERRPLPATLLALLATGARSFYRPADERGTPIMECFDFGLRRYRRIPERHGVLILSDVRRARGVIRQARQVALVDLGEGVLGVDLGERGTLGLEDIEFLRETFWQLDDDGWQALVVASSGESFCTGLEPSWLARQAQQKRWEEVRRAVAAIQATLTAVEQAPVPVVAAVHRRAWNFGAELVLSSSQLVSTRELYLGFSEFMLGLIPTGCAVIRLLNETSSPGPLWARLISGRSSSSWADARETGLVVKGAVAPNPRRLLHAARLYALASSQTHRAEAPATELWLKGEALATQLRLWAWLAWRARRLGALQWVAARAYATVVGGGSLKQPARVSRDYLLELVQETFLSLCGQPDVVEALQARSRTEEERQAC